MESLIDRMKQWENWSEAITNNVQTSTSKVTIIENDFKILVNDLKTVDSQTQNNAQEMKQINDDLKIFKTDLGRVGAQILPIDSNVSDLRLLKDFVGMNNYHSLDAVMAALGYLKGTLTEAQILSMGFMKDSNISNYDLTRARVTTPQGIRTLGTHAQWVYDIIVEHHNELLALEGFKGDAEERLDISDLRDGQYTASINGLRSYTGADTHSTLDAYINSLGFVKTIGTAGGVIDSTLMDTWGFIRTEKLSTVPLGSALCGVKDANNKFRSINDVFGSIIGDLGILDGRIGQFGNCLRVTGNGLGGLTSSISDETNNVSTEFAAIETDMGKIRGDFEKLKGEIEHFFNIFGTPSVDSGFQMIKNLMGEFRNFITGGGGFNGVSGSFGDVNKRFGLAKDALTRLKAKAETFKSCAETI